MPLFKSQPARTPSPSPQRKGRFFSSTHRSTTPSPTSPPTRQGIFTRRRDDSLSPSSTRSSSTGFFGIRRNNNYIANDPSIISARKKVVDAESAEKEADRALSAARDMVRGAREHVKVLEREALEDTKRAKAKHAQAKIVSKSASGLGRHGT